MRPAALRVEFVATGAALLVSLYAAVLAAHRLATGETTSIAEWLGQRTFERSASAVLLLIALLAGASIIGAVLAQSTFRLVGRASYKGELLKRLSELKALGMKLSVAADDHERRRVLFELSTKHAEQEILPVSLSQEGVQWVAIETLTSIAWAEAGPEVIREVEYRRSNRQLFLGCMPSVGALATASSLVAVDRLPWPQALCCALVSGTIAWLAFRGLKGAARYQDQLMARLLLDAAFAYVWLGEDRDDTGR